MQILRPVEDLLGFRRYWREGIESERGSNALLWGQTVLNGVSQTF